MCGIRHRVSGVDPLLGRPPDLLELILEYISCWFNLIEEIPIDAVTLSPFISLNSIVIILLRDGDAWAP